MAAHGGERPGCTETTRRGRGRSARRVPGDSSVHSCCGGFPSRACLPHSGSSARVGLPDQRGSAPFPPLMHATTKREGCTVVRPPALRTLSPWPAGRLLTFGRHWAPSRPSSCPSPGCCVRWHAEHLAVGRVWAFPIPAWWRCRTTSDPPRRGCPFPPGPWLRHQPSGFAMLSQPCGSSDALRDISRAANASLALPSCRLRRLCLVSC